MTDLVDIDADRIAPKLWVGSWPDPHVFEYGFDVVVLCAIELQALPFSGNGHVVRMGIDDNGYPSKQDQLTAIAAARVVNSFRADGKRVLVTCAQGKNRSALVAAIALMQSNGLSASTAIAQVRANRKLPERTMNGAMALANPGFVTFLHELEKSPRAGARRLFY